MRIASISLHWPRTKDSGVGKKLDQQIRLWQAGGHEARLFMHTSRYAPLSALIPAEVIPYDLSREAWYRIQPRQSRQGIGSICAEHTNRM